MYSFMLNPLCDAIHYRREFLLFMSNEHCVVPWPVWCGVCGTMMCCVVQWCVILCGTVWYHGVVRTAYKKELDIEKKLMFRVERLERCV